MQSLKRNAVAMQSLGSKAKARLARAHTALSLFAPCPLGSLLVRLSGVPLTHCITRAARACVPVRLGALLSRVPVCLCACAPVCLCACAPVCLCAWAPGRPAFTCAW